VETEKIMNALDHKVTPTYRGNVLRTVCHSHCVIQFTENLTNLKKILNENNKMLIRPQFNSV